MEKVWKSPRKIEEEIKEYRRKRFEDYMESVDKGAMTLELACQAMRDEVEYQAELAIPEKAV